MSGEYKKILTDYYDALLGKHGKGFGSVNWGSEKGQQTRFRVLCEIADLRGQSVLDLGCGRGDLCAYLRPLSADYLGVDLHPGMIEIAKAQYPENKFQALDVLDPNVDWSPWENSFDYVLASGIFPNRMPDNWTYWHDMVSAMWRIARKGIAFNMLSDLLDKKEKLPEEWYADPADVLDFCFEWTPYTVLRHDYKLNDFTVYMRRNPPEQKT